MKREVDLSRAILKFIEEHCPARGGLEGRIEIDEYDRDTINAHVALLIDDDYVAGRVMPAGPGQSPLEVVIFKLTNKGHDAIALAANDTLWNKTKKAAVDKGIPLTFSALIQMLKLEASKHFGLPPS
jgi:hypothetical protein